MADLIPPPPIPADTLLLDIRQVAHLLGGISEKTVERMWQRGEFPRPTKLGRLSRWSREDVERWVRERSAVPVVPAVPARPTPAR